MRQSLFAYFVCQHAFLLLGRHPSFRRRQTHSRWGNARRTHNTGIERTSSRLSRFSDADTWTTASLRSSTTRRKKRRLLYAASSTRGLNRDRLPGLTSRYASQHWRSTPAGLRWKLVDVVSSWKETMMNDTDGDRQERGAGETKKALGEHIQVPHILRGYEYDTHARTQYKSRKEHAGEANHGSKNMHASYHRPRPFRHHSSSDPSLPSGARYRPH